MSINLKNDTFYDKKKIFFKIILNISSEPNLSAHSAIKFSLTFQAIVDAPSASTARAQATVALRTALG